MPDLANVRDFVGYGRYPPDPHWPNGARLALVIVLNVEEGAEPSIPDGNAASELALTDAIVGEVPSGTRDLVAESLWEYGSRVGFWRLFELFVESRIPVTINACAQSLERNPEIAAAIREAGFD
ncbi:MAG: chitin deacetylase, partial [Bradyrhizobiaceae bacterium]|nr:chitin deacetylase [Bradyrhizobiaceae bacterium]